ncbi:MAG: DUF5058 family protein [Clostridia bacterium]|nr:DUF5058 family protein [Clostridia bacterium]
MFSYTISAAADIVNNPWFFAIYALVVAFVLTQSVFYLVKSLRRAKKINMDMNKIKKVISSSALFSILPSIGIFVGIITLIGAIGVALPAIRLSIIGALQYETQVVDTIANRVANSSTGMSWLIGNLDAKTFVTIALTMTVAIIWGPLFCLCFYRKVQPKLMIATKKDSNLGNIIFAAAFIGMVLAYLCVSIGQAAGLPTNIASYYNLIAVGVAALLMFGFDILITKYKQSWLENFSLAFSMLAGMAVVALINYYNPTAYADMISVNNSASALLNALGGVL